MAVFIKGEHGDFGFTLMSKEFASLEVAVDKFKKNVVLWGENPDGTGGALLSISVSVAYLWTVLNMIKKGTYKSGALNPHYVDYKNRRNYSAPKTFWSLRGDFAKSLRVTRHVNGANGWGIEIDPDAYGYRGDWGDSWNRTTKIAKNRASKGLERVKVSTYAIPGLLGSGGSWRYPGRTQPPRNILATAFVKVLHKYAPEIVDLAKTALFKSFEEYRKESYEKAVKKQFDPFEQRRKETNYAIQDLKNQMGEITGYLSKEEMNTPEMKAFIGRIKAKIAELESLRNSFG